MFMFFFQQSLCLDPTDVPKESTQVPYASYFRADFPEALPSAFLARGSPTCSQHSLCLLESSQNFQPAHLQPHKWGFIVRAVVIVWCHTSELLCILSIILIRALTTSIFLMPLKKNRSFLRTDTLQYFTKFARQEGRIHFY